MTSSHPNVFCVEIFAEELVHQAANPASVELRGAVLRG
jgi:hypothetical protein